MPTILSPSGFIAQTILDSVSRDMRQLLSNTVGTQDATILLDYVNRVQLDLLRTSSWQFILSPVKRFLTEPEQTDYWFGTTGQNPAGTVDTGLNITDLGRFRQNSVIDRSNFKQLLRVSEPPIVAALSFQDSQARPGRPATWRNDPTTPNVLNIYPAPDNQNTYRMVSEPPVVTSVTGGALAARTYYVKATYLDGSGGESSASTPSTQEFIPANKVAFVQSPTVPFSVTATGVPISQWKVYISTTLGSEVLQSTLNIGTNFTEPGTGLIGGAAAPTSSTLAALNGYAIEFRYFQVRPQVTAGSTTLLIPVDYLDVVVAGVNYLTALYLKRPEEASEWNRIYVAGKVGMIRDKNMFPKGAEFIRPDSASLGHRLPAVETFDSSFEGINS